MRIGIVGLGKMGGNMARRIMQNSSHVVIGFDRDHALMDQAATYGVQCAQTLEHLVEMLGDGPRLVWMMVPAGKPTQSVIEALAALLEPGDVVVDGGNSNWRDTIDHYTELQAAGIHLVDVGTSGGVHGLQNGYCMMVGGQAGPVKTLAPILDVLAPEGDMEHGPGWLHVGEAAAGHYVKMVHNGIEYGMMAALGEGLGVLHASEFDLNLAQILHLWMQGSVVRSWLVELAATALDDEGDDLAGLQPVVADSGEGRWTVDEAVRLRVPASVIAASLFSRFDSQGRGDYANKIAAALRMQFGGHAVERKE